MAPVSPPDDPVRGVVPCFMPPRVLQFWPSFHRIPSVASDSIRAPVRGTGFTPGRSSLGASAVLHSALDAPIRGFLLSYSLRDLGRSSPWHQVHPGRSSPGASAVLLPAPAAPTRGVSLSYSLRCLGRSSPRHRVHPRTIQSGGLRSASFLPGCSNPGGYFVVLSPPPRTPQSVAPGSPPDDPVRGLMLCFIPPRQLHSGASFCRILPVASDAPVRGTGFTPGRSSQGARAVLPPAPDAPIRGVMFLSLLADFGVCVRGASVFYFFFSPPLSTLRFALSPPSPPSPPPVLSSPAPFPSLCGGFAAALKLLVSTRTCCYVLGRAHTFILLLPFLPLFSCIVPPFVPPLVACTLCCLCLPLVLSSFVCLGHAQKLLLLSMQFATILIFHSIICFALLPHAFYVCLLV